MHTHLRLLALALTLALAGLGLTACGGSGSSSSAYTTLKITEHAPIPSASEHTTANVNSGCRASARQP